MKLTLLSKALPTIGAMLLAFNANAVEYKSIDAAKSNVAFSYKQMGVGMDGKFKKFPQRVLRPIKGLTLGRLVDRLDGLAED